MDHDRQKRVEEIFAAALGIPPSKREEFLRREAGGDEGLMAEAASLLAYADEDDGFLENPQHLYENEPRGGPALPESIGGFRVSALLGSGGMGEVYLAEQTMPIRRQVALKLIKRGVDTRQVLRRFDAERQALALMSHPNIARVYDAGATEDGRPFFVMEYVDGIPAVEFCDLHRLDTRARLELFIQICEGVSHAHQKGIIHRDIKSSNVQVVMQDAKPVPKIIDFGIAKATGDESLAADTVLTEIGQFIGTPEYMSPEQADLGARDVDTRSDVYSLGVLLYLLLVGHYPIASEELRDASFEELRRKIREEDPPLPSTRFRQMGDSTSDLSLRRRADPQTLIRALRGDLDWITMKALEKERERRYASAADLAADVRRFLDEEPVQARPPSRLYVLRKFIRRHRAAVVAASVVVLALLVGVAGIVVGLVRALEAEKRAREEALAKRSVLDFIHGVFQERDPDTGTAAAATVDDILAAGTDQIDLLADQPLEQAELMALIGEIQMRNNNYDVARKLLEGALEIKREIYGEAHPDVLTVINELGVLSAMTLDDDAAQRYFERALELRGRISDEEDEDLAAILKNLADTLTRQGELERARRLHERALEIRRRDDPDSALVARSMRSIADLHAKLGDYERAIPLFEESLAIRLRTESPGHYRIGYGHFFLGQALREAGRTRDALPHCEQALEIWRRVFEAEPMHHLLRDASFELALTLTDLGEYRRAEPLFERALEIDEEQFGAEHPYVAETLEGYASLLRAAGRRTAAEGLEERAAAILATSAENGS